MPSVGSKGKPKSGSKAGGPPRSRNTTPLPPGNVRVSVEPPPSSSYFRAPMSPLSKLFDVSVEEMLSKGGGSAQHIPSGTALNLMRESIQNTVMNHVKNRSDGSDRVLRELQKMRSQRTARDREREREKAADKEAEERKHKLKKVSKKREPDAERPLAVGAHGVARQDGMDLQHKGELLLYWLHGSHSFTACPERYCSLSPRESPKHQTIDSPSQPHTHHSWPDQLESVHGQLSNIHEF